MKSIILILALSLSQSALASSYYVYCSNPKGTVVSVFGHAFSLKVTVTDWSTNPSTETAVDIDPFSVDEQDIVTRELANRTTHGVGYYGQANETLTYVERIIKKTDGTLFPKGTPGVSEDRTQIKVDMICSSQSY